ncbi:MAG TPA: hypothetical protein ENL08_04975, partial [Bacteroidetes bacterium]|nr:hypothetical protein [Bacteroidota bacterium]
FMGVSAGFGQRFPSTDHQIKQAEQTARQLLKRRNYSEAISFLQNEIELHQKDAARFPFYLMLIDALLSIGDLDRAQSTIAEAESHITWSWDQAALDKLKRRHSAMQDLLSDSVLVAGKVRGERIDTLAAPQEATPGAQVMVTNSFFEADLRMIMSDLSMETGIPILWDPTLKGLVTYEAIDKPLEEVLAALLFPNGFTYRYVNGAYYVGSVKPGDPAFTMLSTTKVIPLANIIAREAVKSLSDFYEPYVKVSESNNTVCITAPPIFVDRISEDLKKLDRPPVQISIEVIVVELSTTGMHEMGLDWTITRSAERSPKYPWSIGSNHTNIENGSFTGDYTQAGFKVGGYMTDLILQLQALVESGDARIRANPRITTMHGRQAEIGITRDQYFVIQTTGGAQQQQYNTLQSVSSGIRLEITPYASESGEITVEVNPQVGDVVGQGAEGFPEINTRSASTSVRVKDGETFTIGGLNIEQNKITRRKIPVLGDIPLFGYLFRYDKQEMRDTDLVIFITPRLLKNDK